MERGSSVVECRTRNQVSPGSNPPLLPFRNVSDLVVARNCCLARMLPREAELVSERTGLSGRAKSVKRFERSNGLDTALYKNIPLPLCHSVVTQWYIIPSCLGNTHNTSFIVLIDLTLPCLPAANPRHLDPVMIDSSLC